MIPKSCRLFGQDHASKTRGHDPEKLQTFRIRSCLKDKGLERNRDSTLSDFALAHSRKCLAPLLEAPERPPAWLMRLPEAARPLAVCHAGKFPFPARFAWSLK